MEQELLDMFPHTISVQQPTVIDSWGNVSSWGTAVEYRAFIQPGGGEDLIHSPDGSTRVASWTIYVASTSMINAKSKITLPLGFDPRTPTDFSVRPYWDEQALHHVVILV